MTDTKRSKRPKKEHDKYKSKDKLQIKVWLLLNRQLVIKLSVMCTVVFIIVIVLFSGGREEETPISSSFRSQEDPVMKVKEDIREIQMDLEKKTGAVNPIETSVSALSFNVIVRPMVSKLNVVWCPDTGGGKANKLCSKGFAEYVFNVPKPGVYYVYVETVAPNINDNSLWVGSPNLLETCPANKAGGLVPHKHVKSKTWLCCPKYLANNAKKGQAPFYSDCCSSSLGPAGQDVGCVLDLEVDEKPHWNMLPRELKITNSKHQLVVKLYAREDGTAISRIFVSANPSLKSIA